MDNAAAPNAPAVGPPSTLAPLILPVRGALVPDLVSDEAFHISLRGVRACAHTSEHGNRRQFFRELPAINAFAVCSRKLEACVHGGTRYKISPKAEFRHCAEFVTLANRKVSTNPPAVIAPPGTYEPKDEGEDEDDDTSGATDDGESVG